jgi:micrococcal nuclease
LENNFVTLESDETQGEKDKYGRLLRYVFLPDGTNFNLFMIEEGYAHEYTYSTRYKYQDEFRQAEVNARNNNKGLWSPTTCSGNK